MKTGQIIDSNWPYRTRVLVRAPQASKFNGFLVVEWANVTMGQDMDFAFAESYKYLLREGYAVAVVSAQRVGVDRLKTWSPERYETLSVAADVIDPQNGKRIDDCGFPIACPGDPLSWDIMTQVSKALKDNVGGIRTVTRVEDQTCHCNGRISVCAATDLVLQRDPTVVPTLRRLRISGFGRSITSGCENASD